LLGKAYCDFVGAVCWSDGFVVGRGLELVASAIFSSSLLLLHAVMGPDDPSDVVDANVVNDPQHTPASGSIVPTVGSACEILLSALCISSGKYCWTVALFIPRACLPRAIRSSLRSSDRYCSRRRDESRASSTGSDSPSPVDTSSASYVVGKSKGQKKRVSRPA
jgi:hypothetical protein